MLILLDSMIVIVMLKHALIAVILAYGRSAYYVYAYLLIKTVTSMLCEGSVFCIALAYVVKSVSVILILL